MPSRRRPSSGSFRLCASATTRATIAPTVRHATRISFSTAERLACLASHATWSSNIKLWRARCLAQGNATTTIPCSGQRTRGASASRYAGMGPRSRVRQRRRPSPRSYQAQRR